MKFLDFGDQTINLAHVVSIYCSRTTSDSMLHYTAVMVDGSRFRHESYVPRFDADELSDNSVIPSHDGYWLLNYYPKSETEPEFVTREQIIGWRCVTSLPDPITVDSIISNYFSGILRPDMKVLIQDDALFDTENDWIEEMRKRSKKEKQRSTKIASA